MNDTQKRLQLIKDPDGYLVPTLHNIFLVLVTHPEWSDVLNIKWTEKRAFAIKEKEPPLPGPCIGQWDYHDTLLTVVWLQSWGQFAESEKITPQLVYQAVNAAAMFKAADESMEDGFIY